jgi:cytochrome c553
MNRVSAVLTFLIWVAGIPSISAGDDETPIAGQRSRLGEQTFNSICSACHGIRGEGKLELKTPSIASLPEWYVAAQLRKFQASIRGARTEDSGGQLMHAVAKTLDAKHVVAVARQVAKMPRNPTQNTLRGDLQRGEYLFGDVCMQCHRYNGSGEKVFQSPPLYGLQDWYIAMQLKKFRAGIRGGHKDDVKGAKMHLMVNDLRDKDLRGVASYISVLAARYLPASGR